MESRVKKAVSGITVLIALLLSIAAFVQAQQSATPPQPTLSADPPTPLNPVKHAPATPIDKQKAVMGGSVWNPQWDLIVEDALPPSMLSHEVPRDVRRFCPRFYRMTNTQKRAFWAYFFQALAGAEAGLDPTSHVRHRHALVPMDHVTHRPLHCEGLLQLAYEDSQRYGCNFNWEADRKLPAGDPNRTILRPKNNLECGVTILVHQIIENHEPIFTRRSYWATLRPGTYSYHLFARQMVSPPEACGYPSRTKRIVDWVVADPWRALRAAR